MWRTPIWYNNARDSGAGFSEAGTIYLENDKTMYDYTATTARIWLSRFMMGENRKMGVVRRKYEALTFNQLLLIGDISEEDW